MATEIILPQGGQDLAEAKVARWLKAEGDKVAKDELLCEIETEKAAKKEDLVDKPAEE